MINTDEFYLSYVDDPVLKQRMEFVEGLVTHKSDLVSLGAFSMIEGAVLYSSFAYLKHFQAKGKNKLLNVVRGINFSVRDENLHCVGGSWLYQTLLQEKIEAGEINADEIARLHQDLYQCAREVADHELRVIDMVFEKGEVEGITKEQMKMFAKSRVNICLTQLSLDPIFDISNNIVAGWFYDNINSVQLNDFFSGIGSSYNRDWNERGFTW